MAQKTVQPGHAAKMSSVRASEACVSWTRTTERSSSRQRAAAAAARPAESRPQTLWDPTLRREPRRPRGRLDIGAGGADRGGFLHHIVVIGQRHHGGGSGGGWVGLHGVGGRRGGSRGAGGRRAGDGGGDAWGRGAWDRGRDAWDQGGGAWDRDGDARGWCWDARGRGAGVGGGCRRSARRAALV